MYVIWNLTSACPWNCEFCCVAAKQVCQKHPCAKGIGSELDTEAKLAVLRQLINLGIEIDFSGGDPLFFEDDYVVVDAATKALPKGMIDVSTTGAGFTRRKLNLLMKVGTVEMTLDTLDDTDNPHRPSGYSASSMRALAKLASAGVQCSAVTILYPLTMKRENLASVHKWICENNISRWSILKFSPVGRGFDKKELIVSDQQYLEAMRFIEQMGGSVKVAFQHSLRVAEGSYTCHAAHESFGILPDGAVVSCAWALDRNGRPLNGFQIGKLPDDNLGEILQRVWRSPEYKFRPASCRIVEYRKREDWQA